MLKDIISVSSRIFDLFIGTNIAVARYAESVDYSQRTGKCGKCGSKTYLLKGTMTKDCCPYCGIIRELNAPITVY